MAEPDKEVKLFLGFLMLLLALIAAVIGGGPKGGEPQEREL